MVQQLSPLYMSIDSDSRHLDPCGFFPQLAPDTAQKQNQVDHKAFRWPESGA